MFESRTANAGVFFLTAVELSAALVEIYSVALDDETNPMPGWVFLALVAMTASVCAAYLSCGRAAKLLITIVAVASAALVFSEAALQLLLGGLAVVILGPACCGGEATGAAERS